MLTFLIIFNLFITLVNLYLALKIWKLRQILTQVTDALNKCEANVHLMLSLAPKLIYRSRTNIYLAKERYQKLQFQLTQIKKIVVLLVWLSRFCRSQARLRPLLSSK
jgi:hypothetical protein